MSINGQNAEVTYLAALIEHPALHELGIPSQNGIEAQALRFVFQQAVEDLPPSTSALNRQQKAAQNAVEEVGIRYALYEQHYEDFFKGPHRKNPLIIALFCNVRTLDANSPQADDNGDMIYTENHFDEKDVIDANHIFDQAYELGQSGYQPEIEEPIEESIFLAHIFAIEYLNEMGESLNENPFEEYTQQDIIDKVKEFKDIRSYLRADTEIGAELQVFLDGLEAELESAWPEVQICNDRQIPYPANDFH